MGKVSFPEHDGICPRSSAEPGDGTPGSVDRVTSVVHAGDSAAQPTRTAPPSGPDGNAHLGRHGQARREIIVGIVLVFIVVAGGVYFAFRPRPSPLDAWILDVVTRNEHWWFTSVTDLRNPGIVVAGAVIAWALAYRRDRPRSWACLLGPPLALVTSELVIKPLVGRTLGGVFSYPSGSTVGAAALAVAAILVTPTRWRAAVAVVASAYAVWMALAVTALQWHLPTDALAGLAYGVGVMLVADGSAARIGARLPHRVRRRSSPPVAHSSG
jgi:hypothetical protein